MYAPLCMSLCCISIKMLKILLEGTDGLQLSWNESDASQFLSMKRRYVGMQNALSMVPVRWQTASWMELDKLSVGSSSLITQNQHQEEPIPFDMSAQNWNIIFSGKNRGMACKYHVLLIKLLFSLRYLYSSWCLRMNYFLGWPLLTTFPPHPSRHKGMIKQFKWILIWMHTQSRPQAFYSAQHSCLVSCEVVVVCWPFSPGSHGCTEANTAPTPCCFALRDANTLRLHALRSCSSVWQRAPTGSLPRKKPLRESPGPQWNTCFTKGTAGFSEQPRQSYRNPGSMFFQMKTGFPRKNTAALEATNVKNDMLQRAFTCSKPSRTF